MYFYLVDVKSTVRVNGKDVAFDYINTYCKKNAAIREARALMRNPDVLDISIHKWKKFPNGEDDHTGEIAFHYINQRHREWKKSHYSK